MNHQSVWPDENGYRYTEWALSLYLFIMKEAHDSKLSIHPGSTKMYQDLKQSFWWTHIDGDQP